MNFSGKMALKVLVLALVVSAAYAAQCGVPAITPLGSLNSLFAVLGGKSNGRIVGGVEAIPHSFPWQVAMVDNFGYQFCGGSIISNKYILSAAHCCGGNSPSQIKFKVGAHNKVSGGDNAKTVSVKTVHEHPDFEWHTAVSDLCVLELSEPLEFNEHVSPVCLADETDGPAGHRCIATGWGSTQQRDDGDWNAPPPKPSDVLQQAELLIVDQEVCKKVYGLAFFEGVTSEMICAREEGKGTCQGDSGGPLVCQSAPGAPFKQVGVVSWGGGCADNVKKYPGVFARTAVHLDWIASIVG